MASHSRKRPPIPVIIAVVLLLIGGGIWWWWSATQAAQAQTNQFSGSVEADQFQIAPAVSGRVTEVKVSEGDQVTKGQLLVQLDTTALKLQRDQAKQGVVAAKAALTNARNDGTSADVTAAKARLAQAEAAVKLAEVQLSYASISAPRDGLVTSVVTNVGQNASPGKTVATIIDATSLFVRIYVPETGIGNVKVGQPATLRIDSAAQTFTGQVSFVASQSEFTPNSVQTKDQRTKLVYQVRVRVEDSSGTLKAGMPADVTLG
ncbi:MAG: efflux RND transporter periplasmic adaptor subunit [Propionibacteriales bacterium]|nr:efflux RND transporter periplasmic adaptor subunit [Propionibacteriales bacterium]